MATPAAGAGAGATTADAAPGPKKMVLVVAVALIDAERRVLLAQRPPGRAMAGLWEFPGGKVDPGEVPEAALVRELREELAIDVDPSDLAPLTFASHGYDTFHLLMPLYACRRWQGEPRPAEGQRLAWVRGEELGGYEMPAADVPLIEPILAALAKG
ncbi:NTP pyrophosphohydrolase [Raphidocelis subcapitata]|uniref:8-oxo-dGTP diphosphatase n=1 Tax=Raphidocelis subcapitata TaxID=307507 RepID=A0A2V0PF88_9CHLO|nr:NTP pyrophosphohydrolase [Raphidocelis subcapitata]|eukprot:GBF96550.1 NTP pyrophosphohydrolase [Raphidocelis subcapitata]